MRFAAALVLLASSLSPESFDCRVSIAKAAEEDAAYADYQAIMFEPVGQQLTKAVGDCFGSLPDPSGEDFTIVADLAADGRPTNIATRPETNVAKCVASRFRELRFAVPPKYPARNGFPIVLDMHMHVHTDPAEST